MQSKGWSGKNKYIWNEELVCCVQVVWYFWGCSKCYHCTNDLPYAYFMKATLDCDKKMYLPGSLGTWTHGTGWNFLASQATILHKPEWPCSPLVVVVADKGPCICCVADFTICSSLVTSSMCHGVGLGLSVLNKA